MLAFFIGCPYSELLGVSGLISGKNKLLLLSFLTTELQACRILAQNDEVMDIDQEEVVTFDVFSHRNNYSSCEKMGKIKNYSVYKL